MMIPYISGEKKSQWFSEAAGKKKFLLCTKHARKFHGHDTFLFMQNPWQEENKKPSPTHPTAAQFSSFFLFHIK